MVARLDGEERARRALIGAVSHDLRTPITALRLLADADRGRRRRRDDVARVRRAHAPHVTPSATLIDDLFELTRLEAGELRWSMEQVALDELVARHRRGDAPGAEPRRRGGRRAASRRRPAGARRRRDVQRVLFNLIQNAIRHTPADGTVTVRAARAGEGVEIEVADTGAGIPAEDARAGLRPFHRSTRRARTRAPASGSRSRARSSRPTAGASGSPTPRGDVGAGPAGHGRQC